MALFTKLSKYSATGLLIMRVGLGIMMVLHGYPKLAGGSGKWAKIGGAMANMGVTAYPEIWGLMASLAECLGGVFLILGFFFRPSCLLLLFTMIVACMSHLAGGDGIMGASHAIELGIVFLGLFILGPGKYSIDKS
ncbi:MAG: DoxX family protein [Sphingobacteriales bacterium]|nr:MAG: DoxX family protein [Sphingobacteriales bacterium]